MLSLEEFTNKYLGKSIVFKNGYGKQCYNLPIRYWHEVCSIAVDKYPICPNGSVIDFYNEFSKIDFFIDNDFDLVKYSSDYIPSKGDIVIYDWNIVGFVEIVLNADKNTMTVLAQNPYNQDGFDVENNDKIQIVKNRPYKGVLGYIKYNGLVKGNTNKDEHKKFKDSLLTSILDIKEHMNDLRKSSFKNAIGEDNEDHYFIANEFKIAWDKSNEAEQLGKSVNNLNKQIQILKSTRDISPNAIGYKPKMDTTYSDSIIKSLNDNLEPLKTLDDRNIYIPTQSPNFDLNKFIIGTVKDGTAYLVINILLSSALYIFLIKNSDYNKDKILNLTYSFYFAGLALSILKSYTNIIKIKLKKENDNG
jgi:hypothetical protein